MANYQDITVSGPIDHTLPVDLSNISLLLLEVAPSKDPSDGGPEIIALITDTRIPRKTLTQSAKD